MDLGRTSLRRSGINTLRSAIHPKHGLAWTDGQCVFLAPVTISHDQVNNDSSLKLGQFQDVRSLHWSSDTSDGFCYLCVRHQSTVSLWKVEGQTPHLGCRQVRKINASPIEQGCLWNPTRDILCLLLRDQCSFYFRHSHNKGSYVLPPIESGRICCGCWSEDGLKLIVGVGSIVLIYQWSNIDRSISEYDIVAWKIPGVDGAISCMVGASDQRVLCTTELPLERLCCSSEDLFEVPDGEGDLSVSREQAKGGEAVIPVSGEPQSQGSSLIHLHRKQLVTHDSSQLVVFETTERMTQPHKLASVNLPGMLTPHQLYYNSITNTVLVGSNSQPRLQAFHLCETTPAKLCDVTLAVNERPLGVCGVVSQTREFGRGVLLMVGRVASNNSSNNAFVPTSLTTEYHVRLCYRALTADDSSSSQTNQTGVEERLMTPHQSHNGGGQSAYDVTPHQHDTNSHHIRGEIETKTSPAPSLDSLILPGGSVINTTGKCSGVVLADGDDSDSEKELQLDTVSFADQPPQFGSDVSGPRVVDPMTSTSTEHPLSDSDFSSGASALSDGEELPGQMAALEEQMRVQTDRITALQVRIEEIQRLLEDSCCIPEVYSPIKQPEVVHLVLQGAGGEGAGGEGAGGEGAGGEGAGQEEVKKTFLLDCGRLQLEQVKLAFQLATVELIVDGNACVLGSNTDGYIPVRFTPQSTMYITGSRC